MLEKILKQETCANCRFCCQFDCTDLWELPVLPEETAKAVQRLRPAVQLVDVGTEQTFAAPALEGETLFSCPMLGEHGCCMGKDKPFDCKIWPFRMMLDKEGVCRIAVSEFCHGMEAYTDQELREFLQQGGLAETILDYAETHPSHKKPYAEEYRFIL